MIISHAQWNFWREMKTNDTRTLDELTLEDFEEEV